jgi:hypothetical protein
MFGSFWLLQKDHSSFEPRDKLAQANEYSIAVLKRRKFHMKAAQFLFLGLAQNFQSQAFQRDDS